MIKNYNNYVLLITTALSLITQIRNTKVEIKDISGFLPGYIAVFSCPDNTVFEKEETDGVLYTLKVSMYLSDKDNLPVLVAGTTNATENVSIKIKASNFEIKLSKSNFTSLFGDAVKTACDYTWKNLETLSIKKESMKAIEVSSEEFAKEYDDGGDLTDVEKSAIQFGEDSSVEAFTVANVNLLQVDGGKGAASEEGYEVAMFVEKDPVEFSVTMAEQEMLKKLYEGDGSGNKVWYKQWWFYLTVALVVLLIVGIIVAVCVKGKGESYEGK